MTFLRFLSTVFISAGRACAEDARSIRIALFDDEGSFGKGVSQVSVQLGATKDMKLTRVKGADIAACQDLITTNRGQG